MSLPDLGDALPGAERALARALAAAGSDDHAAVQPHLVALLESAGGPDVGNAVRAHLERAGLVRARPDPADPHPPPRTAEALLDAAYALHCAAQHDLRAALSASGLAVGLGPGDRRRARAEHAATSLAARDVAVTAVLGRLRAGAAAE